MLFVANIKEPTERNAKAIEERRNSYFMNKKRPLNQFHSYIGHFTQVYPAAHLYFTPNIQTSI